MATESDNVEIYGRLIAAFNEGGADAVLEFFAEDVEVYDPDLPGDGTFHGRDGLARALQTMMSGNVATEVLDFKVIPAGDRVIGLTHTYARDASTEIEVRDAHALTFRDGKIVYWRLYLDPREALSDAGIDSGVAAAGR